ncbi:hypothetical protein B0T24DRAFT_714600 [Lasiosphaeria ovina]|uniref:Uncharacterized protein n=1 Tax=Lasiosphaeria ovina TaxID=92902 RepID=A0AAE0NJ66_9PEZI|nr:hypothetical protein B0T24DRAFT_714600 [Lasiosphaeria ovina]
MSLFSAQLHPGRALGFLVLGASLHDILTRLKAEPQRFPKLDIYYTPSDPVREPVMVGLPANGLRLRFDGPEQRLRLIEVTDFSRTHIFLKPANDKERDLVRPGSTSTSPNPASPASPHPDTAGPTFRHIYQRFLGPTYDGEFIPDADDRDSAGLYVLSYPGVAFTFPMKRDNYAPSKDVVSLLSSSAVPTSMAVFSGDSWAQARETMWTEVLPSIKMTAPLAKSKDVCPDEVSLVRVYGGGKLQLFRRWTNNSFWLFLGDTTPQQLVAELGPPDAIYRKNDQRMYIHKLRAASNTVARPDGPDLARQLDSLDLTDTDQSSHAASDEYDSHGDDDDDDDDDGDDEAVEDDAAADASGECFWNYFYMGFDILMSPPTAPSRPPPTQQRDGVKLPDVQFKAWNPLVATKIILHANVPGSYPFNRHRRCRWEIPYLPEVLGDGGKKGSVNSETPFAEIEESLRDEWKSIYASEDEARQRQRGMVLNRGWGDSPGSSCELLGGWEESGGATPGVGRKADGSEDSTTTLYGFPGLVFEVLKNGNVSAVTVF